MGITSSLNNLIARAVLNVLNTATKCQGVSLTLIGGEPIANVEHIEPYGFTSAALAGAEAVVLFPSGDRSHGVAIAVADRRYRLKGLAGGEVAIYTDEGDSIILKRDNVIEATTKKFIVNAEEKISLNAPEVEVNASKKVAFITPDVTSTGNVAAEGEVSDGVGKMSQIRVTYNGHAHTGRGAGNLTDKPDSQMGGG